MQNLGILIYSTLFFNIQVIIIKILTVWPLDVYLTFSNSYGYSREGGVTDFPFKIKNNIQKKKCNREKTHIVLPVSEKKKLIVPHTHLLGF